jgi:hypothetical protein
LRPTQTACFSIGQESLATKLMGDTHPLNKVRIENISEELLRWGRKRGHILVFCLKSAMETTGVTIAQQQTGL